MLKEAETLLVKKNIHTREVMQDDGVTIKTLVMVPLKKHSELKAKKEFVSCAEEQCLACDETDDVEGNWCKLKKILLNSTEKVCGRTKGPAQQKSTWWWDGKVEKVIKEK